MNKETRVYILTREGRAYNEKGTQYVLDTMKQTYGIDKEDIILFQGSYQNDAKILGRELLKHGDVYIFLSRQEGVSSLGSEGAKKFGQKLLDSDGSLTSWEMAQKSISEQRVMIYILAEDDRKITEDEIQFVCDEMANKYEINKDKLAIAETVACNNAKQLGTQLLKNDASCIFVSRHEDISSVKAECTDDFCKKLLESDGSLTSWEIANDYIASGQPPIN